MLVEQQASSQHWPLISLPSRLRGDPQLRLVVYRQKSGFEHVRKEISVAQ